MTTSTKRVLLWTPRVLGILFAIFLSGMAVGVGWSGSVQRFGSVLCGLDLGTLSLGHLLVHFRPLGLGRCSISVQLDIQSTAANAVVAA